MRKYTIVVSILVGIYAIFSPTIATANNSFGYNPNSTSAVGAKSLDVENITTTVGEIANIIIGIVAAISVLYIIYGAVVWMSAGADKGKVVIVNAIVGLILAILAFFIVQFAVGTGGWLNELLDTSATK